jgi:hypothetical protein
MIPQTKHEGNPKNKVKIGKQEKYLKRTGITL